MWTDLEFCTDQFVRHVHDERADVPADVHYDGQSAPPGRPGVVVKPLFGFDR